MGLTRIDDGPQTLPSALDATGMYRALWLRRAGVLLMALVVAAGAVGLLGVHSSTVEASGAGYSASFTHASIARAGWDVPWKLQVSHPGGFSGPVTVSVTANSMLIFETQRFWPEPTSETRDSERIYLTFDPPPGDELVIDYDGYVQPSSQRGITTDITVIADGEPRLSLHARTTLLP